MFVRVIDCLEFGVTDVAVTNCKLHVHLRFGGLAFGIAELGNECPLCSAACAMPPQCLRKPSATNDEFDRLAHIARRREIFAQLVKHVAQFRARFDKHPNLENA